MLAHRDMSSFRMQREVAFRSSGGGDLGHLQPEEAMEDMEPRGGGVAEDHACASNPCVTIKPHVE